jgi:small-conductance mechanosensitive channel
MTPFPLQFADVPGWLPFSGAVEALPELVVQLAVFALATAAVVLVGFVVGAPLVGYVVRYLGAHDRLQQFVVNLTRVASLPAALVVGLFVAGFDLASFGVLAVLLIGLLGFVLATDNVVRDTVSGFYLLVAQPFDRGDWIAVDDVEGRVERINVRTTDVRTFDNETVRVPNALLNEQPVTNRSAQSQIRQQFHFGIAYDEDVSTAMEAVTLAARQVEGVAAEPVPEVRAVELEPSWVTLRATIWLDDPTPLEYIDTRSQFIRGAKAALMENQIDINPNVTELSGQIGTAEVDTDNTVLEREHT